MRTSFISVLTLSLMASLSAFAGDNAEVKGMITSRTGDTLLVKSAEGNTATVVLEANRQDIAGHKAELASQKESIENNQQNIAANKERIEKNIKDIEENTNRFTALADYDVKGQATVNFNVGSSTLSAHDKDELKQLGETAKGLTGYIVEVVGYADSSGSAAINTKLSEDRAKAVVTYLMQQCGVPVRHIIAPGAMGEYGAATSNETKAGRAQNRRVEVKVLVNKGIAG